MPQRNTYTQHTVKEIKAVMALLNHDDSKLAFAWYVVLNNIKASGIPRSKFSAGEISSAVSSLVAPYITYKGA